MNTGQVLMSVAAFVFLGTVLVNFNNLVSPTTRTCRTATTSLSRHPFRATYLDMPPGNEFRRARRGSSRSTIPRNLTSPNSLGPDCGRGGHFAV